MSDTVNKGGKDRFRSIIHQISLTVMNRRRAMWLNQSQLAEKMNVPQSLVARLESGDSNPTLATLVKFADFFDMRVTDLFLNSYPGIRRTKESEVDGHDFICQNISPKETCFLEVDRRDQVTVRVRAGDAYVKVPYLKESQFALKGYVATIPGGGEIEFINIGDAPAEILVVKTPRREGRF